MRQNPRVTPAFKAAFTRLRDSVKKAKNALANESVLKDADRLRKVLDELMAAADAVQDVRRAQSRDKRAPSASYTTQIEQVQALRQEASKLQQELRSAIVAAELLPKIVDVPATISQSSYDITVNVANTYPAFKTAIEDVAERIHTYVNMNDVSADYTIAILGSSAKTGISADLDLDMLKISVSCPLNVDSQDIIEQIVEGLVIVWDLEDPEFDDDVMGVLAEI